jgi:hypothetical protein
VKTARRNVNKFRGAIFTRWKSQVRFLHRPFSTGKRFPVTPLASKLQGGAGVYKENRAMPKNRNVRNDGEKLAVKFTLPKGRKWRAAEITHICDRNKFQILNVARSKFTPELGTLEDPFGTGNPTRLFTTAEVYKLMQWFDDHGRRHRNADWREKAS